MKKLLVLILSISLMAGCQQPGTQIRQEDDRRLSATPWWREDFDGHTYVIRGGSGHGWGSGMTHDPDCKCYSSNRATNK